MASTLDQLSSAVKELQVQSVNPVMELEEKPSYAGVPTAGASTNSFVCESSMLNSLVNIQQKLDNIETAVSNLHCNSSASSSSSGWGLLSRLSMRTQILTTLLVRILLNTLHKRRGVT